MSRFFLRRGRFFVAAFLITLLGLPGFGQVALREALDFDGDQKADFTIFRPSENAWYILGSTGSFTYQQWGLANEDRLVPGDYDGDNKADIAVWRDSEGYWYVIHSSTFTFSGTQWGTNGDEPVQRDYDGDGKTDHAVVRRTGGYMYWWVLQSTGGFTLSQWGLDSDFAVPGDFDGDGKFDLCVQRPGNGPNDQAFFYILGTQNGIFGAPWGLGSDYVVPGDYDGDGKTDIAVVREGANPLDNLVWYVLRSDLQGYIIGPFGLTGFDYNTQADYDGDGKTDISVFRPSEGLFYVFNSRTQSVAGANWGGEGDLPLATYDTH